LTFHRLAVAVALFAIVPQRHLLALNSRKELSQYTRTVWTQAQGLPQDTIRAITQTGDGFLWLGTDEGLVKFDGYDFTTYTKDDGVLPSNSVTTLYASTRGALWIATANGLTRYQGGRFTTFTTKDGLPNNAVTYIREDYRGALWIVAGPYLSRFENGSFSRIDPRSLAAAGVVRAIYEDPEHRLWIAGRDGIVQRSGKEFVAKFGPKQLRGDVITAMLEDRKHGFWIAGNDGLILRRSDGSLRYFDSSDGLPNNLVRVLWEDRKGNLWAGTDGGLSRLEGERFVSLAVEKGAPDWVKCLFEDREGNLWVGMNSGLNRFRDDRFTTYGRPEGLPSDSPLAVHQDRNGRMWVGYHDVGLVELLPNGFRTFTSRDGLAGNEVFRIRESRNGDLLIGTRFGFSRMHNGRLTSERVDLPPNPYGVYDVLEDSSGRLLVATPTGVHLRVSNGWRSLIPGGSIVNNYPVVLQEGFDGSLWAGTYGGGLWQLKNLESLPRLYTTTDGLGSNQIRSLYQDKDGTLWIGTFGGGLVSYQSGRFFSFTTRHGLLSDNVAHIEDDGKGSLWLSTTKGICRISKKQLLDLLAGKIKTLDTDSYTVGDGLRSAQCAPGYPIGGSGARSRDGRLWFPTSLGLSTADPDALLPSNLPPIVHLAEVLADGRGVDFGRRQKLSPGIRQIQFRYTAIHLRAPERVRYQYRLEGLDTGWQSAGARRVVTYNTLAHGNYRLVVKAMLPGGASHQAVYAFEVLPHFYENSWFLALCALLVAFLGYGAYRLRLAQVHGRFSLILEERMRLAREIHDTLAQGFVGIRSQLEALAIRLREDPEVAQQHLEIARKMANHSLTEARRSVMDLRASNLEDCDLPSALTAAANQWLLGTPVRLSVEITGERRKLPDEIEKHLLRIAQEAVTNTIKHAGAEAICLSVEIERSHVRLKIQDNGRGFHAPNVSATQEHFGILGMQERTKLLGGHFDFCSQAGAGTTVEVRVPIGKE
jgi:signal transduction histidine kinase/ligand-binding sensor domain-containing protein